MCNSPLHDLLTKLPKCEHHVHLEGTLSPALLFELADKNSIALPDPQADPAFTSPAYLEARYREFTSLDDFLAYYYIGFRVLLEPSDFEALAYAYLSLAASQNVRHAEVFFDPQGHLARGVPVESVIEGFRAAAERARGGLGITALLIPCLLRHFSVEDGAAVFDSLLEKGYFSSGALAGLGLCSTEIDRPPTLYRDIFERAREHGIPRTAHAGEEGPPSYISSALSALSVSRIDHGVRAASSPSLLSTLATSKVLLTVCPLSNVALRGVSHLSQVPIRTFLDAGVRFSINSDDPAYFGGYIQENYCAVQEAIGLSVEEWKRVARNSVEGSWCDGGRKGEILKEVEEVVCDYMAAR